MQDVDVVWLKAEEVFGDKAKAAVWLATPNQLFGGQTAIDYVKNEEYLEQVIEVLTRIEHGYAC
ncbi:MbcA/ParS/Xre antitoxin family protein [Pseudomonas sp. BP8]|uniref:MbcA/ParS/Xre antitoxin family protein n=1 Tax=Pseudomonas sp. BP8 TaxID=2817864 RepID=UPI001AE3848A|nr:MbcA/ParS/Xre antitoxin family protein [Pseudomonas sp. BP8]MBP2262391.1 uncharacterized protein (DUF2384 family) [Pseudomonas sp. BP8]HDS1733304.1 DUF2384 domain-containing protein [Pseudomonas putida]